jgi:hypothetical protein
LVKSLFSDLFSMMRLTNKEYKSSEDKVEELKLVWVARLNESAFHGGDVPDGADFKVRR